LNNVIKTISLDSVLSVGYKIISRGLCAVDLVSNDGNKISLYCQTPVIASCSVSIKSDFLVSYRGCSTIYQTPTPEFKPALGSVDVASIATGSFK